MNGMHTFVNMVRRPHPTPGREKAGDRAPSWNIDNAGGNRCRGERDRVKGCSELSRADREGERRPVRCIGRGENLAQAKRSVVPCPLIRRVPVPTPAGVRSRGGITAESEWSWKTGKSTLAFIEWRMKICARDGARRAPLSPAKSPASTAPERAVRDKERLEGVRARALGFSCLQRGRDTQKCDRRRRCKEEHHLKVCSGQTRDESRGSRPRAVALRKDSEKAVPLYVTSKSRGTSLKGEAVKLKVLDRRGREQKQHESNPSSETNSSSVRGKWDKAKSVWRRQSTPAPKAHSSTGSDRPENQKKWAWMRRPAKRAQKKMASTHPPEMALEVQHNWEAAHWDWPLQHADGVVRVTNTKEKFEVGLDAQHFTPSEIQVKVVGQMLEIHFEHATRNDAHGAIQRSITRTYRLPDDVEPTSLKSSLNTRGTLVITAGKKS